MGGAKTYLAGLPVDQGLLNKRWISGETEDSSSQEWNATCEWLMSPLAVNQNTNADIAKELKIYLHAISKYKHKYRYIFKAEIWMQTSTSKCMFRENFKYYFADFVQKQVFFGQKTPFLALFEEHFWGNVCKGGRGGTPQIRNLFFGENFVRKGGGVPPLRTKSAK